MLGLDIRLSFDVDGRCDGEILFNFDLILVILVIKNLFKLFVSNEMLVWGGRDLFSCIFSRFLLVINSFFWLVLLFLMNWL